MTRLKKSLNKFFRLTCLLTSAVLTSAALLTCEKVPDYCGRYELYNPEFQFCFAGKAHNLCAGSNYNPLVEGCIANTTVGTRCLNDTFVPTGTPCAGYSLSTAAAPADGGSIMRTPDKLNYSAEEEVIVMATAAEGYEFAGWAGMSTSDSPSITITMNSSRPLVAVFNPVSEAGATAHRLVTTAFPENGGTITRSPNTTHYPAGTGVTITATAAAGFTFAGWSGERQQDTSSTIRITTEDVSQTLVAMFTPIVYTLTVNAEPTAGGRVFINRTALSGVTHQYAGTVEALAQPMEGYVFTMWSGVVTSALNPITINVTNNNQTLTANFRQQAGQHTLTVVASPAACATDLTGGGTHNVGSKVPISVTAAEGCTFTGWTGATGIADTGSMSTSVLMDAAKTVTANFTPVQVDPCAGGATPACCAVNPSFPGCQQQNTWEQGYVCPSNDCAAIDGQEAWDACPGRVPAGTGACGGGGDSSFTDERDGKTYRTVVIGTQTWMAENLNYEVLGSWCYDNNSSNCDTYGRLYDWATAMNLPSSCNTTSCASQVQAVHQGICPPGWHVPSDAEWSILVDFVGSSAGAKLKALTGWRSDGNGTDDFGFSALPGGLRWGDGSFDDAGNYGNWWSATELDATLARYQHMSWYSANVYTSYWNSKTRGSSARCVAGERPIVHTLTVTVSPAGAGSVTLSPPGGSYTIGTSVTATAVPSGANFQFNQWSTGSSTNPLVFTVNAQMSLTAQFTPVAVDPCAGGATPACCAVNPSYPGCQQQNTWEQGYACPTNDCASINSQAAWDACPGRVPAGTGACGGGSGGCGVGHGHFNPNPDITYGCFTDERDDKSYSTVVIDGKTWMAENLNWAGDGGDLGWCYNNAPDSCSKYGRLYDWSTVMGFDASCNSTSCASQVRSPHQGICPPGWHVPSDAEWDALAGAVGSNSGTKLKTQTGWNGTDDFGFSALPGGGCWGDGNFGNVGGIGYWWSATEIDAGYAWDREMREGLSFVNSSGFPKFYGFSLRCVRD